MIRSHLLLLAIFTGGLIFHLKATEALTADSLEKNHSESELAKATPEQRLRDIIGRNRRTKEFKATYCIIKADNLEKLEIWSEYTHSFNSTQTRMEPCRPPTLPACLKFLKARKLPDNWKVAKYDSLDPDIIYDDLVVELSPNLDSVHYDKIKPPNFAESPNLETSENKVASFPFPENGQLYLLSLMRLTRQLEHIKWAKNRVIEMPNDLGS